MDPVLELEDVALSPGGTPVLRGVNLVVERGEFVGISGPNGVGKSTLVRAAASLLMPSSGIAKLFGVDVTSSEVASVRTQIGSDNTSARDRAQSQLGGEPRAYRKAGGAPTTRGSCRSWRWSGSRGREIAVQPIPHLVCNEDSN